MTEAQMLRMRSREILDRKRRERMWDAIKMAVFLAFLILAFGLAGAMDLEDRAASTTSMMPDAGWEVHE